MPDTPNGSESIDDLIEQFNYAQKQRRTARYLMTLLIAAIVFIFIFLGVNEIQSFQNERMGDFAAALMYEAEDIRPMVMEELEASANRAVPAVENAIVDVFTDNQDEYLEVLSDNYVSLQAYAQARWPMIEDALAALVVHQEETARSTLAQYIEEDKLVSLSSSYRDAMSDYLDGFFSENVAGEMVNAQDMFANLQLLAEREPDMPPEDSQYILGMFIELLGIEMQLSADLE